MIKYSAITFAVFACIASTPAVFAQTNATAPAPPASAASAPEVEQNINQYIDLMRKDVRSRKVRHHGHGHATRSGPGGKILAHLS